eukprot:TRINITY_DN2658_c0_g1_i7.p1 TRINITY_DN2658_c0_g1~~TRINITY_DN2658_c0_g1_i7.p1  ORF type:complete len:224 (+),score=47.07 TRINITY_DN2658_c0_g1_i7:276-947(+)
MSHLLRKQRHRSRSLSEDGPPDLSNVNPREFNSLIVSNEEKNNRRHSSIFKIKKDPNSPSGIFNIENYEQVRPYSGLRSSDPSSETSSNPFPGIRLHSEKTPPSSLSRAETAPVGLVAEKREEEDDDAFVITPEREEEEEEEEVKESESEVRLESESSSTPEQMEKQKSQRELRKAKALLRTNSMFMAKVFEFAPRRTVPTQVFKSKRIEVRCVMLYCGVILR